MRTTTTTIWRTKEINILRKHYPDMGILTAKLNKSAYKINKKAGELGLMTVNSKQSAVNSKRAYTKHQTIRCKLYEPKHRPIAEIEAEIARVEDEISKGIDIGPAWNNAIQQYNALCTEYDRALGKTGRKTVE
ncbi:hypothetical protein FACS1894169_00800 [Bacteroidia bacterium]|nr:hypothetical protein FACS1894169_00800 [Bacteroidia bacterium]